MSRQFAEGEGMLIQNVNGINMEHEERLVLDREELHEVDLHQMERGAYEKLDEELMQTFPASDSVASY